MAQFPYPINCLLNGSGLKVKIEAEVPDEGSA